MSPPAQSAERIFQTARSKKDSRERAAYLEGACGEDLGLRAKVEALLKADTEARQSASHVRPASVPGDPAILSTVASTRGGGEQPGNIVGRYKLLELIGEGGFGAVWMAEQREPVKRRVALKIIKLGMDTKQTLARFEVERQALAMMDHPNIARVLDAGATDTGRPFFVMELVRGVPVTDYCDTEKLSTANRLDLFTQVCNAVQHAHQKGIIHRDLKPSNVLVTLHDGVPVPKIIDFGIAKATHAELTERTLFTEHRQMIGTPAYMSPEQAEMSGLDIDTRTDIYSLGVLLYELLTGTTPFDPQKLQSAGYNELVRILREEEPHRPSNRLSTMRSEPGPGSTSRSEHTARQRGTDLKTLARRLKGDLDWIVMKCLEKDRRRRYDTANGLAIDIRRHLSNEPIVARPPSTAYRIRKFARRNKALVIGSSLVAAVLVLGIVGTSLGFARAVRERDRTKEAKEAATNRAAESEAVTAFLTDMLAAADPAESGKDVLVRQVLDKASKSIPEQFRNWPIVEARLRATMGKTYLGLGFFKDAEPHLAAALETRRRALGEDDPGTIQSMNALASLYWRQGRFDEAQKINEQALDHAQHALGEEHPDTLKALSIKVSLLKEQKRFDEALSLSQSILEACRRVLGREHPDTLASMNVVGNAFWDAGQLEQAASIYEQALSIQRRRFGEEHPTTLSLLSNIGNVNAALNREGRTEEQARQLETARRVLGDEHPITLTSMSTLANDYFWRGRFREALPLSEKVLETRRRVLGEENRYTLDSMFDVARVYWGLHRHGDSVRLLERAVDLYRRTVGDEHPQTYGAGGILGFYYRQLGQADDGRRMAQAMHGTLRRRAEQHPADADYVNPYAWALLNGQPVDLRDPARARSLVEPLYDAKKTYRGMADMPPLTVTLQIAQHRSGDTASAIETILQANAQLPEDHVMRTEYSNRLVRFYVSMGRDDEARQWTLRRREELRAFLERNPSPRHRFLMTELAENLLETEFTDLRDPAAALPFAERACTLAEQLNGRAVWARLTTLALAQGLTGKTDAAIGTQERALAMLPEEHALCPDYMERLATFNRQAGRAAEARRWSTKQLEVLRTHAEQDDAITNDLNSYAWALLTVVPEDLRDPGAALALARRACGREEKCGGAALWLYLDTLAMAEHMTGDTAAAVRTQERAVTLAPKEDPQYAGLPEQLAKFKAVLGQSVAGQPASP